MRLADYLAQKRMSATEFADLIGVNKSTVGRWLEPVNGKTVRPSWEHLPKIVEITGGAVTANDFLESSPDDVKAVA